GTLVTTFTSPAPPFNFRFGHSMAALGSDKVLIGALIGDTITSGIGPMYLFSTNGTLLTTFIPPSLEGSMDCSVAAVGSDGVLIGNPSGDLNAGGAYLFSANGALLTTFTNPAPAAGDQFGYSVAAVGLDRVLISAIYGDTGATDEGAVYLFSTNGTLLTTFTNPFPASLDEFGSSVAALGSDRVLIGAR